MVERFVAYAAEFERAYRSRDFASLEWITEAFDRSERLVDRLSAGAWHEMQLVIARHPELFPAKLLDEAS